MDDEREIEIDGVPVEEIAPGVYQDADGNVQVDGTKIETYNGIPISDDE